MNQEKIGKFITECRKEKKLTQQELAEKLGVTNRSVSNWENGKNMPDLSLFKPLCEEFDITINELLSAQRLRKEEYQEKFEENILNTIDFAKKKTEKKNKLLKITIFFSIIIIIAIVSIYSVQIYRINHNLPNLFTNCGEKCNAPIEKLDNDKLIEAVQTYLVKKNEENMTKHNNKKSFVSYKTLLLNGKSDEEDTYILASLVYVENYYFEGNKYEQDSTYSIPQKFVVKVINNKYVVIDSRSPRSGSYYNDDMKNIFPDKDIRNQFDNSDKDGTLEKLKSNVKNQLTSYISSLKSNEK